jgi:DNA-binding LytR/AlgR family response regulator
MSAIKIGIVEDEGITSEVIKHALQKLKYKIATPAFTYNQALQMFETEKPDLVILDIKLEEERDGIDLAVLLKEKYKTPFIFLTANSDSTTLERAKKVRPLAFLVKPFSQVDLHATIEIAFNNYRSTLNENNEKNNFVVMKVGRSFEKVNTNEILFLENENHYFNIHFSNSESISVRASSTEMMDMLPQNNFIQISRTYIVNTDKIIKMDSSSVFIGQNKLEYKATLKEEILKMIG